MKIAEVNNRLIDGYWALLKKLDPGSKLDLIAKLSGSLKSDLKEKENSFQEAFGAWDESDDAEEIIQDIRSSSVFSRKTEDLL